jgi:cytochrome P450
MGTDGRQTMIAPGPAGRLEYNPRDAGFRAWRHAAYSSLRAEAPVFWSDSMQGWIVTRYQDVVSILLDSSQFSAVNSIGIEPFDSLPAEVKAVLALGYPRFPGIIEMDPPEHTRYRNLVNLAFTPRRIAALEPRIRAIAHELIDRLPGSHRADFVTAFGDPLPIRVIGDILGVPIEDMDRVQVLSDSFRTLEAGTISELPLERQIETARQFVELQQYVAGMVSKRLEHPADDLVSVITGTRLAGERPLQIDELVSTVIHLLFAGQETTTRLLASTVHFLLDDPTLWASLISEPSLASAAIEEGLRMDPPVTYHLRLTKVPVEIGGVTIPADAPVHLVFASANRDDAAFENPSAFDLHRSNASRHLGFGRGIHFCVGAPIGRLEGRIGLEALVERVPSLRLAALGPPVREDHIMLSGIATLPIEWDVVEPRPHA